MKIKCVDVVSGRSDFIPGGPTGLTKGKIYDVAEVLETQFSIVNDKMKIARYSQYRFKIVDATPVKTLRENFNCMTTVMRDKIKELEKEIAKMKRETVV
jgi:hypothetical protein